MAQLLLAIGASTKAVALASTVASVAGAVLPAAAAIQQNNMFLERR